MIWLIAEGEHARRRGGREAAPVGHDLEGEQSIETIFEHGADCEPGLHGV